MTCTHRVSRQPVSYAPSAHSTAEAWSVRDEILTLRDIELESGARLARVNVRFRLEGSIAPARDNVVLVVHALTGTPEASDWWKGVIGKGNVLDPRKHAILCANLLGGCAGTSGPSIDDGDAYFPTITTRDQATVLARVLDALGVAKPLLICGGSLGGMVALEFAASFPARVQQVVVLAAPAAQTAQALAWHAIMRRAIAVGGTEDGLALARMVGMLSYRTANSLEQRFARQTTRSGVFEINEWMYAHGEKLVQRFDARSYVALIDAMDAHDVGRGRGGIANALKDVASRIIGVGIPGDILFTNESVQEWCTASGADYRVLESDYGHDAFLLETERVSAIVEEALERSVKLAASRPAAHSRALPFSTRREVAHRADVRITKDARPIRVALAGCGHVGGALLDLFSEHTRTNRQQVHVSRVLVRDASRERPSLTRAISSGITPATSCTTNPEELLADDVDVLVELIGGTTTSQWLVENALQRGIRVVTANKALLATRGPALAALAASKGTTLDYEGAVAAAVPVIRCLRSGAAGVGVSRIRGIVNGTTNVVLERVSAGESLADAIAYAQSEGFAEADPTRDLSGEDAEDKLRVLAWLAFGVDPKQLQVERRGIDKGTAAWAAEVARDGDRVKLIASAERAGGSIVARVVPERVSAGSDWTGVHGPCNRIVVESDSAGSLIFQGPGAGGRATAGAVFGDLFQAVQ